MNQYGANDAGSCRYFIGVANTLAVLFLGELRCFTYLPFARKIYQVAFLCASSFFPLPPATLLHSYECFSTQPSYNLEIPPAFSLPSSYFLYFVYSTNSSAPLPRHFHAFHFSLRLQ